MSQQTINQAGSYMLAPSYSEALLMDPAPDHRPSSTEAQQEEDEQAITEMVPSYSEALLYRRADQGCVVDPNEDSNRPTSVSECSCPCHAVSALETGAHEEDEDAAGLPLMGTAARVETCPPSTSSCTTGGERGETTASGKCASCGKYLVEARLETAEMWSRSECSISGWSSGIGGSRRGFQSVRRGPRTMAMAMTMTMPRDMSEPNLRSRSESLEADTRFLRLNGQSLRNILESEQEEEFGGGVEDGMGGREGRGEVVDGRGKEEGKFRLSLCSLDETNSRSSRMDASRGAIPKRICGNTARSRVIANPMSDEGYGFAADTNAYFCLKSILKQNKRRYTLITARELQNLSDGEEEEEEGGGGRRSENRASYHEGCAPTRPVFPKTNVGEKRSFDLSFSRSRESLDGRGRRRKQLLENEASTGEKGEEWKERGSNR